MSLSSFALAVLLLLGFSVPLTQTGFYKMTRVTTASSPGRDSRFPSVSADGTKVAFESDSDFLNQGIPNNQFEIWLYDTTTMTLTRVTSASHPGRISFFPDVSADGTKVAFVSDSDFLDQGIADDQFEIWLYDTTTMTLTRVTSASHPGRISDFPSLSADGTKISFESDSDYLNQGIGDGQLEIWLYDTTTMTLTRVTSASHAGRTSFFPGISADGTKIAFSSNSDFLNQGISQLQNEIWLFEAFEGTEIIYLPVIVK
jgi:Tol biopolymer transport system component